MVLFDHRNEHFPNGTTKLDSMNSNPNVVDVSRTETGIGLVNPSNERTYPKGVSHPDSMDTNINGFS